MSSTGQTEVAELPASPAGGPGGTVTNEWVHAHPIPEDVPGTVEVAEDLRREVLFHEARRLRRRRSAIGATVVAVVLLAAGTALSPAGHLSASAPGPRHASRENAAALTSGAPASLYFRPVECTIATPSAPVPALRPGSRFLWALSVAPYAVPTPLNRLGTRAHHRAGTSRPHRGVASIRAVASIFSRSRALRIRPGRLSGSVIAGATAAFASPTGQWVVDITFSKAGSAQFNDFAAKHYRCDAQDPTNPPFCALQAVELGGTVLAAPPWRPALSPEGRR